MINTVKYTAIPKKRYNHKYGATATVTGFNQVPKYERN